MHSAAKQYAPVLAVAVLVVASVAFAGGPAWPGPNHPPPEVPKEAHPFWRHLASHAETEARRMADNEGPKLGYNPKDYTQGDLGCMSWLIAWASAEKLRRENPLSLPKSFTDYLERNYKKSCHDDDSSGPGAPTGRGWNTIKRTVGGRADVQRELLPFRPLTEQERAFVLVAAKWAAVGGAALLALPSLAVP